jgi:ADP-ribosylglycohydrolase
MPGARLNGDFKRCAKSAAKPTEDRVMLGALIGDIVGSYYEFRGWKKRDFDPFFHPAADFTDDSVCTVALAQALLDDLDPAATLRDWCRRYPGRGYGGMFQRWIRDDTMASYGSYGNGAAMRVSAAALIGRNLGEALALARRITAVTHDHPEGLTGAAATVHAIVLARQGANATAIREVIVGSYGYNLSRSVTSIRSTYGFTESCQETVPEAITCALEAGSFEGAIRDAVSLGGDADTVGAIAGAIAEARFGIPEDIASRGWSYLSAEMRDVMTRLYARQAGTNAAVV